MLISQMFFFLAAVSLANAELLYANQDPGTGCKSCSLIFLGQFCDEPYQLITIITLACGCYGNNSFLYNCLDCFTTPVDAVMLGSLKLVPFVPANLPEINQQAKNVAARLIMRFYATTYEPLKTDSLL